VYSSVISLKILSENGPEVRCFAVLGKAWIGDMDGGGLPTFKVGLVYGWCAGNLN